MLPHNGRFLYERKMRPRPRRIRGLAALRVLGAIDGAAMAAGDEIELRALEALHDRAARLARRGFGVRGWS